MSRPWRADRPVMPVRHLLRGQRPVVLYRIVRGSPPRDDDLRSAFVLGTPPPRKWQLLSTPIWMGLSMRSELADARDLARRFPLLGPHVARLEIVAAQGTAVAATIEPGHFTVWGRSWDLLAGVTDVYRVGEEP